MGLQQLSGIDGVLFYAPVLFAQAGQYLYAYLFFSQVTDGLAMIRSKYSQSLFPRLWSVRNHQYGLHNPGPVLSSRQVGSKTNLYYRWIGYGLLHVGYWDHVREQCGQGGGRKMGCCRSYLCE